MGREPDKCADLSQNLKRVLDGIFGGIKTVPLETCAIGKLTTAVTNHLILPHHMHQMCICLATAGQEQYHSLVPMYFRQSAAVILVYDVTKTVC